MYLLLLLLLRLFLVLTFARCLHAGALRTGRTSSSTSSNNNKISKKNALRKPFSSPFLFPLQKSNGNNNNNNNKEQKRLFFSEEEVEGMKTTLLERASAVSTWTATNMHTHHPETRRYKLRRERGITRDEVRMMQLLVSRLTNDTIASKYNSNFFSNGRTCTSEEERQQVVAFKANRVDICYEEPIYKIAHMGYPEAEVFVDVGCNKGYTTALIAGLWSGHNSGLSPYILFQHYAKIGMFQTVSSPAGYCRTGLDRAYPLYCPEGDGAGEEILNRHADGQCDSQSNNSRKEIRLSNSSLQQQSKTSLKRPRPLSIYSFDGSSSIIQSVSSALKSLPVLNASTLLNHIHLYTAAMSDQNGNISFGLGRGVKENGFEGLSLLHDSDLEDISPQQALKVGYEVVQMMTLDTFAATHGIQHKIQFLKIDAEGHDLLVIKGAQSVLNSVGVLIWEQAGFGAAASHTIEYLASKHFECYFVHPRGTIKFTGECFKLASARSDVHVGVNVVCVSRERAPIAVLAFDLLSSTHE